MEARVAFPTLEEPEEFPTPTRRFTVWKTTSGRPDDPREGNERAAERRLQDHRGCAKAARAVVPNTSGLAKLLSMDRWRAAHFCVRYGIQVDLFRHGVLAGMGVETPPPARGRANEALRYLPGGF